MTHDCKRNGTTTLFAALSVLKGTVIGECMPRHRHRAFFKFLRKLDRETPADLTLHLILDNYATHKHDAVGRWLKRHRRFQLHYSPTNSSWLNLVERWFREITEKRIRRDEPVLGRMDGERLADVHFGRAAPFKEPPKASSAGTPSTP